MEGNPDGAYPLPGESAFSFVGKRDVFTLRWFLPARLGIVFPLAQRGPPPGRWRQAVSWRLCRLETAHTLWVLCRLTDGAGKTVFSFVGKWCVLSCSCFLLAQQGIVFSLAQQGPKPLFLLQRKRKSGSGLRKRKGRPVEMITDYGTTVQSPNPAWLSHG